jgi:hypothetical protein
MRGARAHLSALGRRGHRGGRRRRALDPAAVGVPSAASTTARVRRGGRAPASLHHGGQAAVRRGSAHFPEKEMEGVFLCKEMKNGGLGSWEGEGRSGGGFIGRDVGPLVRSRFWSVGSSTWQLPTGNVPVFLSSETFFFASFFCVKKIEKRSQQGIIDVWGPPVSVVSRCFRCLKVDVGCILCL